MGFTGADGPRRSSRHEAVQPENLVDGSDCLRGPNFADALGQERIINALGGIARDSAGN